MTKPKTASIQSAVQLALQFEKDGYEFYNDVSKRSKNHHGRDMFDFFAKDELKHIKRIKDFLKGRYRIKQRKPADEPIRRFSTVFSEMGEQIRKSLTDADDLTALKTAMNIETDGYKFYEAAAQNADSPEEKDLFDFLKNEETQHYHILKSTYDYLNNTADWFFTEEGPMLVGG